MILPSRPFLTTVERVDLTLMRRKPSTKSDELRKAQAILAFDTGHEVEEICAIVGIDIRTLCHWLQAFEANRGHSLPKKAYPQREGHLSRTQEAELKAHLTLHHPRSTKIVIAYILKAYKKKFCCSGAINLLHRLGFDYKKPVLVPKFASEAAQQAYLDLYDKLKKSGATILFGDSVHPQHMARAAGGWFLRETKPALYANTGRMRVNHCGAINLQEKRVHTLEFDTVNAPNFILFLKNLLATYTEKIYLVLDCARYHKAKMVQDFVKEHEKRLELVFLPPYCPHFNPIERFWGAMHKHVTHNKHYPTFKAFADAVTDFFKKEAKENWESFAAYVTDNFSVKKSNHLTFIG